MNYKLEELPVVSEYYHDTMSIPLYYGLSEAEQQLVIFSIKQLLQSSVKA
jgi:dTDP-4-amino-4,6-dideoxygalactose transaminase